MPSPVLTKVISDRLEREYTIEDLEEWTEYELQLQAFNAIGAGPWSEVVRGRTRESGTVSNRNGVQRVAILFYHVFSASVFCSPELRLHVAGSFS